MAMTAVRKRKRSGDVEKSNGVTETMKTLAKDFYVYNREKNLNDRLGKKARAALYSKMKDAGVDSFSFSSKIDGKNISLDVAMSAKDTTTINTEKLLELVGKDLFMQIVSASVTAVKSTAGSDVAMQCSVTSTGSENVNVSPAK